MQTHKWEFIACNSEEQSLNWEMYSKLTITRVKLAILKEKKSHLWQSWHHTIFLFHDRNKQKKELWESQNSEKKVKTARCKQKNSEKKCQNSKM